LTTIPTNNQSCRIHRVHATIATILQLVPKGKQDMFSIIASNAPFRLRSVEILLAYYAQAFLVTSYLPSIRNDLMALMVETCLQLDVEIKITDDGDAIIDEEKEENDDNMFEIDSDTKIEKVPDQNSIKDDKTVDIQAEKLDALMYVLFECIETSIREDPASIYTVYQTVSRLFESSILATHKSKFVQFIVLHVCGLEITHAKAIQMQTDSDQVHATLYRSFAAHLIDVIVDPFRSTVTRQTGACYLASFINRAAYVCPETVCECICALLRWCEVYMQSVSAWELYSPHAREQAAQHALFYTLSQAAFYIMCFRGREAVSFYRQALLPQSPWSALDIDPTHIDIGAARWSNLCGHELKPLDFCLESVKFEFLAVAQHFGLLDESTLQRMFRNSEEKQVVQQKQQRRKKKATVIRTAVTVEQERVSGGVGGMGQGTNPLDSFFPFDPYLLQHSYKFIEPYYKHWEGSCVDEPDNDGIGGNDMREDANVDSAMIRHDEGAYDSDANSDNNSQDDENYHDHINDSDSDVDPQVDEDGDDDNDDSRWEPMSLVSHGLTGPAPLSPSSSSSSKSTTSALSSFKVDDECITPPVTMPERDVLRAVWTETLQRHRAPSVENGSW
jgi:RNA polymerase I-specific transcription initiation factor RRN3